MGIKFVNNFNAPLAVGIDTVATSVTLASGYGALLPTLGVGDYLYATLVNSANSLEIVKVTAKTGDVLTVVRAQDGTTAKTWIVGDRLSVRPCAAAMYDALQVNSAKLDATEEAVMALVPSATTSVEGSVRLATNVECEAGTSGTIAVTPSGLAAAVPDHMPAATTAVEGKVQLATTSEVTTGTNNTKAATPAGVSAAITAALTASGGLGINQTWQSLSGTRTAGTVYQNTSGKPIVVYASVSGDEHVYVGTSINPDILIPSPVIVPNNSYYKSVGGTVEAWYELRA